LHGARCSEISPQPLGYQVIVLATYQQAARSEYFSRAGMALAHPPCTFRISPGAGEIAFRSSPLPAGLRIAAEAWPQPPTSMRHQFLSLLKRVQCRRLHHSPHTMARAGPDSIGKGGFPFVWLWSRDKISTTLSRSFHDLTRSRDKHTIPLHDSSQQRWLARGGMARGDGVPGRPWADRRRAP
jgi:hypothetical protein